MPLGRPDLQDDESSWGCLEPTCRSIAGNVTGSVAFGWRIFRDLSTVCRVTFVDVYVKLTEGSLRRFLYAAGCFQNTNRFVGGMFAFIHCRRTGTVLIAFFERILSLMYFTSSAGLAAGAVLFDDNPNHVSYIGITAVTER